MKRTNRRLISLFLTLCMILSLLPMAALAEGATTHTVTLSLTNLAANVTDTDENTTGIQVSATEGTASTFTLTADTNYTLPASIDVGGTTLTGVTTDGDGTANYYNTTSGKVYLASVTADTAITAAGTAQAVTHTVTLTLTGITSDQTDANTGTAGVQVSVADGGNLDVTLTASAGYALPTSVTVGNDTLTAATTEAHDNTKNYYAPNENKLHLAGVTADVAVTVTGVVQPHYVVSLVPGNSMADHEAGETGANFNIVLSLTNYTNEITNFGDVQFYDITIDYGAGMTYNNTTPATSTFGTISVDTANHTITLKRLDASKNASDLTGDNVRRLINIGSVHFDLPSADYVDSNGIQGIYKVNPTVSETSTITNPGAQTSVQPANGGRTLYVRHTKLDIPAFDHATVSYKINSSDTYTDVAKGSTATDIYVPYNAKPTFKITTDPGYELTRAGVNYYNDAANVSQIYSSAVYDTSANTSAPIDQTSPYEVTANVSMYMNSTLKLTIYEATNTVTYKSGYGTTETTYGTGTYKLSTASFTTRTTPTRAGYTFQNWKVTSAGKHYDTAQNQTAYFAADKTYNANTTVDLDNAYGDVTLTAQWTADSHTNTYRPNVAQTAPKDESGNPTAPKTDESVTVTVTPPAGKQLTDLSIKDGSDNSVSYSPAVNNNTAATDFTFTQPASDATVTPTFSDIGYTVTYNSDGGSTVAAGSYNISTTTFTLPTAPTKQGYAFNGWKVTTAAQGGTGFTLNTTTAADATSMTLSGAYGDVTLTAQWKAATHSTNTLNNSVTTNPEAPATGSDVVVTVPSKPGYTITGVTVTERDGNDTVVSVDNNNDTDSTTWHFIQPAYDVTVTPSYTANSYTLTYIYNDGGTTANTIANYTTESGTVTFPTAPTRGGYTFAGWLPSGSAVGTFAASSTALTGASASLGSNGTSYGDATLTAQWTAASQTNVFPTGDGATYASTDSSFTSAKTGDTVTFSIAPPTGYYLDSLKIQKTGDTSTTVPFDGAINTTDKPRTAQTFTYSQPGYGVTVVPHYTARQYTITFANTEYATMDAGSPTSVTITYGQSVFPGEVPGFLAKEGYKVYPRRWVTHEADGTQYMVFDDSKTFFYSSGKYATQVGSNILWIYDGDVTVYPFTRPETYTLNLTTQTTATFAAADLVYNSTSFETQDVVRAGYTLAGYYTDEACTQQISTAAYTTVSDFDSYHNITYTRQYAFLPNVVGPNGTGTDTTAYTDANGHWCNAVNMEYTFYAKWIGDEHTITLPTNVVQTTPTTSGTARTGDTVTVTGSPSFEYQIDALIIKDSAGKEITASTILSNEDGTLTYTFIQPNDNVTITTSESGISHDIKYYVNSTDSTAYITDSYSIADTSYRVWVVPSAKDGFTFTGWKVTSAGEQNLIGKNSATYFAAGNVYTDSPTITLDKAYGDVTLTAQWEGLPHTNSYASGVTQTSPEETSLKTGDTVVVTVPAKNGYTITGVTAAGLTGVTDNNDADPATWSFVQPNSNLTVEPTYTAIQYTLTYKYDDGKTPDATAYYTTADGTVSLPAAPTFVGYDFAGWERLPSNAIGALASGNLLDYLTGTTVALGSPGVSYGNAILQAKWTASRQNNAALPTQVSSPDSSYANAKTNDVVRLSITPDAGYYLSGLTITKTGEPSTTVTYSGNIDTATKPTGAQTFNYQQPAYGVTVIPTFTGRTYTITLSTAGVTHATGLTGTTTFEVVYGSTQTFTMPTVNTDAGYTASGYWYGEANPTDTSGPVISSSGTSGSLVSGSAYTDTQGKWNRAYDVTLYPAIVGKTTAVTLDANGGTQGDTTFNATYGSALDTTITAPTAPVGYTFAGWTATINGTDFVVNTAGTAYVACANVTSNEETSVWNVDAGTYTLYAKWTGITQTNTLPTTVTQSTNTKTGDTVTLTVTPPTGQKIAALTVTNKTDSSSVPYSPTTFNADGSQQTFTYTQPASGVTVAVTYEYIHYAVTYDDNGATTSHAGGSTSYIYSDTSFNLPTAPKRAGYAFTGWTITRTGGVGTVNGGNASVAAEASTVALASATGAVTLKANWLVTSNLLTVNVTDVNTHAAGTATFTKGTGIDDGSGETAGKYFIKADANANFTLTPAAGYKIVSVSYAATDGSGSGTTVEAANGTYTIPASACVVPLTITVTTSIDTAKIIADAAIVTKNNAQTFQTYSQYSGNKSLVLFNVTDANVLGIALSNGVSVYKTDAYHGYQYAALLDLTSVDKTEAALNTYLQSLLMTKTSANTALIYDHNVNGQSGFMIDDVSVEYDYTSRSSLNWVPYDAYLIIGDIAGNGSSSADRVLDAYDVSAFVAAYQ